MMDEQTVYNAAYLVMCVCKNERKHGTLADKEIIYWQHLKICPNEPR